MNYNIATDPGSCTGREPREQRPHETAIEKCHQQLNNLEALIGEAGRVLAPVMLPQPPQPDDNAKGITGCVPMTSEAVSAVGHVASRISALTDRLADIISRVNV